MSELDMFEMRFVTVRKSFSEKPSDMVIETCRGLDFRRSRLGPQGSQCGEKIGSAGQEPLLRGSR